MRVLCLSLFLAAFAAAQAESDKAPLPPSSPFATSNHPVRFAPADPASPLAPRFSPKGTQIRLEPADLSGIAGRDHLVGRIALGAKEHRGDGQMIALARTSAAAPYDLLFMDSDLDGNFAGETPLETTPRLTREKWWSSFQGSLAARHAASGPEAAIPYPVALWVVVEEPAQVPTIIRFSRRGFVQGTAIIDDVEHTVLVSDGDHDGVLGTGDYWTIGRAQGDDPLAMKEWRRMPDFAWAGGRAFKLAMDGTYGASGCVHSFDPGISQADDDAARDAYKADREAPRAETPVRFETDFDAARAKAAAAGRPCYVKFETTWCGPCALMAKLVFTAKDVALAAEGVVCVKVDGDEQRDLVKRFNVTAYPTSLILDASGVEIARRVGYLGVKEMSAFLRRREK